METSLHIIG